MIPVTPRTTQHLIDWCAAYQTGGTVPQPRHIRFGIGVYQITQGMSWKIASPVRWQSFCAASMHFIMCAEAYDVRLPLPENLADFPTLCGTGIWERVLLSVGRAQQQLIYHPDVSGRSTRSSRYSPEKLCGFLEELTTACFGLTPPEYREQGCFDEMHILTGDLPRKTA